MKIILLGVMGPTQLILLGAVGIGAVVGVVYLITSNSKNKSKADTLDSVLKQQGKSTILDDLERLEKLRRSGGLTDSEFEAEKRKILNK